MPAQDAEEGVRALNTVPAIVSPTPAEVTAAPAEVAAAPAEVTAAPPEVTGERHQVQVIARAAAILRALENEQLGLSLGQIAQRVSLARSTVQRIVAALQAEKLVIAASPTGRVRLGPAILRLAASVETDFASLARPLIAELSARLQETVDCSSVRRDHMVFTDQVIGPQRLRTVSAVGETFPLYCTANGKAYLALLDDDQVTSLIGAQYPARTPRTLTRLDDLLAELARVRERGVAFDREEHMTGVCAAGVALADQLGNMVALSVPVPAQRFYGREEEIAVALLETRRAVERRMATDTQQA